MKQHERRDLPFGNQLRRHHRLAESGRRIEDSVIVLQYLPYRFSLFITQAAMELHINRLAGVPLIPNRNADSVLLQQLADFLQAAPRYGNMLRELLTAKNDAGFVPRGEPHRLRLIELRILESGNADDPIQHRFG